MATARPPRPIVDYRPAQRATSGVYLSPAAAPGGKAASKENEEKDGGRHEVGHEGEVHEGGEIGQCVDVVAQIVVLLWQLCAFLHQHSLDAIDFGLLLRSQALA